jgi:uncharacterized protein HemY
MLDRVYLAGKENRTADAIATLEAWDAKHPNEPETLRELARLLVRSSRTDEAFTRYRARLGAGADTSVRAEYAAALLGAQRYDSAAAIFDPDGGRQRERDVPPWARARSLVEQSPARNRAS